jgi:hypothetical protein
MLRCGLDAISARPGHSTESSTDAAGGSNLLSCLGLARWSHLHAAGLFEACVAVSLIRVLIKSSVVGYYIGGACPARLHIDTVATHLCHCA